MNSTNSPEEDILHIDEHRLDKECLDLPTHYWRAAYQAANTSADIEELKSELKVVEAETFMQIRTAPPSKYGLEKYSEGAIKEIAIMSPKIRAIEAKIRKLEAQNVHENNLVKALGYKKSALGNRIDLHVAGWKAEIKPSEEGRNAIRKISASRMSPPISRKIARQQDKRQEGE